MHHKHESDSKRDKYHAVADLDAAHDKLEENLGEPNSGEEPQEAAAPEQEQ